MKPTLRLRLLGDFSLTYDNQQVTSLNTGRLQSLLAYLVLHRDVPQQRQHLAFLFWPDATEAQARNNLRQLLHQLRQAFPSVEQFLSADMHTVYWRTSTPFSIDVAEFEQALADAAVVRQHDEQHTLQSALEQASTLYQGELLPSCYDEWLLSERRRLRQLHQQNLEELYHLTLQRDDTVTAIGYAQRLLALDPLSEDFSRRLMRLFMLNNDRASALRVYHTCVTTLQRELGVAPDPATQEAYRQLMQYETPVNAARSRQSLLTAPPSLVGREREWQALH
jgi:DNA-binding SARP family transcriptional activator